MKNNMNVCSTVCSYINYDGVEKWDNVKLPSEENKKNLQKQ